ncbi:MAG: Uma2 family endonuclease [Armatimonadota bacterium]|nr:Uma2 family endonuclease [Armatimonadota bacterium]
MSVSLKMKAPPTDEELRELSDRNPGYQFERSAAGELIVTPTGSKAGRRELLLGVQLARWAEADGRGLAFGPSAGFRLPDGSVLSPDASWVRRDRWDSLEAGAQEGFAPLCPDAVFECASRSDELPGLRAKLQVYLANGARLAVLVDPYRRAVEIFEPGRTPRVVEQARSVAFPSVLSGFVLDLEPIFA